MRLVRIGVCVGAVLAICACGGAEIDEPVDAVEEAVVVELPGRYRLRKKKTSSCVQKTWAGLRLRPCSSDNRQKIAARLDNKKCVHYTMRRIGDHWISICDGWAMQLRMGWNASQCIRAARVVPKGVREPAVLGSCEDNLSFWGIIDSRMVNYASIKLSRKMWLVKLYDQVQVKRINNPYDQNDTTWALEPF